MSKHHFIVSLALVSVLMVGSLGLASCNGGGQQRAVDYNSSRSNTRAILNRDEVAKLDVSGLGNLVDEVLTRFSQAEKDEFIRDEFLRTGNYNPSLSNKSTKSISTPAELADFVIGELNKFSEEELKKFFTDELHLLGADLKRIRQEVWKGEEKAATTTAEEEKAAPVTSKEAK